jgi:hypothetical protein
MERERMAEKNLECRKKDGEIERKRKGVGQKLRGKEEK